MEGTAEGVLRLARIVAGEADQTRVEAARGGRTDAVAWESVRAQRYREQLMDAVAALRRTAAELDELAQALAAHARAAQQRLDEIAAARAWLLAEVQTAAGQAQDLGSRAADMAQSAARGLASGVGNVFGTVTGVLDHSQDWALLQARASAEEADQRAQSLARQTVTFADVDPGWIAAARTNGWSGP
jgi:chromosome segregation ATPase